MGDWARLWRQEHFSELQSSLNGALHPSSFETQPSLSARLQTHSLFELQLTTRTDLPPVKPSAIALGTIFTHAASLAVLAPVFGDTYHRAQAANTKEEFAKSKEAASAAAAWGSSLVGSAVQTYGVGALINATGTLSYKGAAYLGSLIFFASSAPSVSLFLPNESRLCTDRRIDRRPGYHRAASDRAGCRWCSEPCL